MLVYWESMVRKIIGNGVVYIKYKNACKRKVMVLNGRLFRQAQVSADMIHILSGQWGECRLPQCVNSSNITAHIMCRHAPQPLRARVL